MEATDWIPKEHFNLWYELFKDSGGRFLFNPCDGIYKVYVGYSFDDVSECNSFNESYQSLIKPVEETKRGFWKRLSARFKQQKGVRQ